jgi:hypothetical protein
VPEVRPGSAFRERCRGRLDTPYIPAINSLRVGLSVDSGRAASSNGHQSRVSYFLSSLPLSLSILLLVVIPTAIAMSAQALVHRWVGVEKLVQNNEIAGFKFATIGVIYAVLLAFTVIVVWEKFSAAENAVDQEAASIAALLRYAEGKEPAAVALRQSVTAYAKTVIEDEWPAMEKESESPAATRALDAVYDAALALGRAGTRETADMAEVFAQTDNITASRRIRLHLATGLVPPVIWAALFAGALLLHLVLRQRESARADRDDRRSVHSGHARPGGDRLDRSPFHRRGQRSSRPDHQRAGGIRHALEEAGKVGERPGSDEGRKRRRLTHIPSLSCY